MKKIILFILFISLSVACHPSRPIGQDTIVVGISSFPEQFDPRLSTDSSSQKINKLIFSGLLKKNNKLNLVPDLAESYQIVDPETYLFRLKDNIFFHDGTRLTSKDIQATYESMIAGDSQSPFQESLSIIQKIEIPDSLTIIFHLKKPHSPFLTLMSLGILSKEFIQTSSQQQHIPVGTGPYYLVQTSDTKDVVHLKRFKNYFGSKAKTENLIFRVILDSTLRTLELIKGRLDIVQNDIPYVLIPRVKQEQDLIFLSDVGINFTYMAFNLKNDSLKNKKVREAISMAIDRDQIIQYKLSGLAKKANSLLSPTHWAYHNLLPQYEHNLNKARRLLDQTPFKDPDGDGPKPRFRLTYKTSSVKERVEIARLIAENLKKIGIDVTVESYEFGTFYRDIRQGDFDIFTLTWVGLTDPDIYHSIFHSKSVPPGGANRGHYQNAALDILLDKSRLETNHDQLKTIYHEIQKIVYDDFVYAPLWYEDNFVFMKRNIRNYRIRSDASYMSLVNAYKR